MTSVVGFRAFASSTGLPFAMEVDRQQEYIPQLRLFAAAGSGTDAAVVDSSASCPHNEMIFERITPSCYLCEPFSASAERIVASSPRELGHGQEANGMSAGG